MNTENKSTRNLRPKKTLGQNFLKNPSVVKKIIEASEVGEKDHIIEIGPGRGALTEGIAERAEIVYAIEKDRDLFSELEKKYGESGNIRLLNEDILKTDMRKFRKGRKIKLISNLPYNITSPVLSMLIKSRDIFSGITIMVQKEVGERIASPPGKRSYGALSVICQTFFDIKKICSVGADSFRPRPKVDSVVIKLTPTERHSRKIKDLSLYDRVVHSSFSSKRKMISNSLKSSFTREDIDTCLGLSLIDPGRRAETVGVGEFIRLANCFYELQHSTS